MNFQNKILQMINEAEKAFQVGKLMVEEKLRHSNE